MRSRGVPLFATFSSQTAAYPQARDFLLVDEDIKRLSRTASISRSSSPLRSSRISREDNNLYRNWACLRTSRRALSRSNFLSLDCDGAVFASPLSNASAMISRSSLSPLGKRCDLCNLGRSLTFSWRSFLLLTSASTTALVNGPMPGVARSWLCSSRHALRNPPFVVGLLSVPPSTVAVVGCRRRARSEVLEATISRNESRAPNGLSLVILPARFLSERSHRPSESWDCCRISYRR